MAAVPLSKRDSQSAWVAGGPACLDAGLGYWNILQLRENDAWVNHSNEVLTALGDVLSTMKDAETGQRGYMITGEDSYLEPYNSALAAIQENVQRVKHLTADNLRQQAASRPWKNRFRPN